MSPADPISGANKRQLKRWYLVMYLRVFDEDTGELLGHIVDINKEGIRLVSDKFIPPNQTFRLWVDVPKESAPRQRIHLVADSGKFLADVALVEHWGSFRKGYTSR